MESQLPKKVVISLGGSTIVPEEIDIDFLKGFRKLILKYVKKGMTFVLISGGGRSARHYQHAASKITKLNAEDLDWLGVHSTRLNAQLLRTIFRGIAYQRVIKDPTKPIDTKKKIIIAAVKIKIFACNLLCKPHCYLSVYFAGRKCFNKNPSRALLYV